MLGSAADGSRPRAQRSGWRRRSPLEANPSHRAAVLVAHPVGSLPLAEVGNIEHVVTSHSANRQFDESFEEGVADPLGEAPIEGDGWLVLDVEEVRASEMRVSVGFSGPDLAGVYRSPEGRVEGIVSVPLHPTVDFLDEATHPSHHHVGRGRRLGVPRLEAPRRHLDAPLSTS